jgi:hypothetical protein
VPSWGVNSPGASSVSKADGGFNALWFETTALLFTCGGRGLCRTKHKPRPPEGLK